MNYTWGLSKLLAFAIALAASISAPIYMVQSAEAATTKVITEVSNGKTVNITRGSVFTVRLNSTYWTFDPLTVQKSLKELTPAAAVGFPPGSASAPAGCRVPGSGCGSVSWKLKAIAKGLVTITANRTSCGEAMRCTPDQGTYSVKIRVS